MGNGVAHEDILAIPNSYYRVLSLLKDKKFRIYVSRDPFPGEIHERELHVSKATDRKGDAVLHLKEGCRFLEFPSVGHDAFLEWLGFFVAHNVAELRDLVTHPRNL